MRRVNKAGEDLIKSFESLELEAYPDPGSELGTACSLRRLPMSRYREILNWEILRGSPWTIGWGHTGAEVKQGLTITPERAQELFKQDICQFEKDVEVLVKVPVSDNQFAALVSFAYNVGADIDADILPEGLGDSTLLKKLNARDFAGAADEFLKWNKAKGKVLLGLTKRRAAERELFLTEAV